MSTSNAENLDKLWSMMKGIGVGMLTTEDGGHLRARPMHPSQAKFEGTLWFFTKKSSHKVDEVNAEHDVGVTFADSGKQDYVSLSGRASLVTDRAAIDSHWSEPLRTWFPNGKDDPDIALLKVAVSAAEYWDAPSSTMIHAYGYVKAAITGKSPDPGGNEKINLA